MLKMSWTNFLIQGIPESIAVIAFCFALLNLELQWPKIIKLGVALAAASFLVRILPLPFGVHTIILIFVIAGIVAYYGQTKLVLAFRTSIITAITMAMAEILCNEVFLRKLDLTIDQVYEKKLLWPLMGLPQVLLVLALGWIIKSSPSINKYKGA